VWDKMLKKAGGHAYFFVRVILEMLDITDRRTSSRASYKGFKG